MGDEGTKIRENLTDRVQLVKRQKKRGTRDLMSGWGKTKGGELRSGGINEAT